MAPSRAFGCLAVAAAVATGCSSSTSPSDPISGNWSVTFTSAPTGTALIPSPWILTVGKSGSLYTVSYPRLNWESLTSGSHDIDTWSEAAASTFAIQNDSLYLLAADTTRGCFLKVDGAFIANTASGTASAFGSACATGSFTWSAKRQ